MTLPLFQSEEGEKIKQLEAEVELLKTELGRSIQEGRLLVLRAEVAEEDILRIGEAIEDLRHQYRFIKPEDLTARERMLFAALDKLGEPRDGSV